MANTVPRWTYGFSVTAGVNDKLDFIDTSLTFSATLNAGTYTPDEYAAEVQRAMRAANSNNQLNTCLYSLANRTFAVSGNTGGATLFTLKFTTNNTANCATVLGFTANTDQSGSSTYTSAVTGSAPSTASSWLAVDPLVSFSPVTAQASGTKALLLEREVMATQNKTHGANIETIYYTAIRHWRVTFSMISASEQANFEALMDYAQQGGRILCQPDSTSTSALRLVLMTPGTVQTKFTWITRPEIDYGQYTFYEQLSGA